MVELLQHVAVKVGDIAGILESQDLPPSVLELFVSARDAFDDYG